MWFGTIPGNDRLHEPSVETLEGIARSIAQTSGALSQPHPDKSQPEIAGHSHFGS